VCYKVIINYYCGIMQVLLYRVEIEQVSMFKKSPLVASDIEQMPKPKYIFFAVHQVLSRGL
jgi:hypothetical protein